MRHSITIIGALILVAAVSPVSVRALEGEGGYSATSLLTASDVKSDVTYPTGTSYVERWQDLALVQFWAPIGPGQRDGIAANPSGDLFVLIWGSDSTSGDDAKYTGLIKDDGTSIAHLTQDEMDSGWYATREGSELQAVTVSPCTSGLLVAGYPVILRHVITGQGDARTLSVEVVMVDPDDGGETDLYTGFGAEASQARVAIDGSGTIYVGPLSDGRIAKLTYANSAYGKSYVPGSFSAGCALIVGPGGDLYTFASDETFSYATTDAKDIYRVVPSTGSASVYASVDGWHHPYGWVLDSDGAFWIALHEGDGRKRDYVTEVVSGEATTDKDRISDSDVPPWSVAAGADGKIYVLENPFSSYGEIWLLTPGSGGGGKPPKKPK